MNKFVGSAAVVLGSAVLLAGCSPTATSSASKNANTTASSQKKKGFSIALSNSYIGNNWRVQMEKDIKTKIDNYKKSGVVSSYTVANAGNSTATQISQIQDIIQKKPDLLLIDAASSNALNPVIKKAEAAGITVVSFDNVVSAPKATKVSVDFSSYGTTAANFLVKSLNGKGNVVALRGTSGTPVDKQIWDAADAVFKQHSGIKVIKQMYANWDEATAQSKMSSFLATGKKVDGIFTEGGEAYGASKAMLNANRKLVPTVGGGTVSFLQMWKKHKSDAGFKAISIGNPPALGSYALEVGLMKLKGDGTVPNKVVMPLAIVTDKNLNKYINQPSANRFDVQKTYSEVKSIVEQQAK